MQLQDVHVNQEVTLASDPAFRGYVVGQLANPPAGEGPMLVIAISVPGQTGLRGHRRFPLADVQPAPVGRSK